MLKALEAKLLKRQKQQKIYYTIHWSPLVKADKYEIVKTVPSVTGFYELYYLDKKKILNLFFMSEAWYGGLRNAIRERTDPEIEKNEARRKILNDNEIYYRYCTSSSYPDIKDVVYFFVQTYFPQDNRIEGSGRYEEIFVKEVSYEKLINLG
jgi:hypothetical protein